MVPFKIEQLPLNLKEEVEQFLTEHPRSPAARLRPDMGVARNMWLAFIGPDLEEGNAGVGHTPREALEDFNSALRQSPQDADALNERCHVEYELGRQTPGEAKASYYAQAFRDIEMAAALDPTDEDIQERLAFMRANIPEFARSAPE